MTTHFIKDIEISNFKCFKNFKVNGLGRVNLIAGKNNIGKTAFMEACSINVYSKDLEAMTMALRNPRYRREKVNLLKKDESKEDKKRFIELSDGYESKTNIRYTKFNIESNSGIKKYNFIIDSEEYSINIREFSYELKHIDNIIFIDNYGFRDKDLREGYSAIISKEKEDSFNRFINEFDNSIEKFIILPIEPFTAKCKLVNDKSFRDLSEFGDGLRDYISIIVSLYAATDGYLFIDEIGTRIHYTQIDRLWEIIFKISKEQNVQVFTTTHSKEFIESYSRVIKKLKEEDVLLVELGKGTNNQLTSMVYSSKWLIDEVEQNHEVRGW